MCAYTVAVAGATGYAGGEMLRLLAAHPAFEVATVTGDSSAGHHLGRYQPHVPSLDDLVVETTTSEHLNGYDVIVLALPHGVSGALSKDLRAKRAVVDLGADHRLESAEVWSACYGGDFHAPWIYGMPELIVGVGEDGCYVRQREALVGACRDSRLDADPDAAGAHGECFDGSVENQAHAKRPGVGFIAGPGCNVTAVTLAFQPALAAGLVHVDDIVADLAVGYSGAGKNLKRPGLLAAEAFGSAVPYSVGGTHRHIPEIVQNLRHAAQADSRQAKNMGEMTVAFTPMLVPMSRGILAVVSARLNDSALALSDDDIRQLWINAYRGQRFIRVLDEGAMPATADVLGSNTAEVQVVVDRHAHRLYGFAAIDNLTRGTAGQAVQSLNLALGLPEEQGLTTIGVAP
jgi:N-acetyl-gamma-glutamyl-phosphate reductase